jgi:carbamoyltransferase
MTTYYLGLSVTYHDSALAIVSGNGEVLFAEATERYLQNKRALNCEADQLYRLPELISQYCPKPEKFVIASNWRKQRPFYENIVKKLGFLSASGLLKTGFKKLHSPLPNYQLHHMMSCQRSSIEMAGVNLVRILQEYYPGCSISFRDYDHHLTHAAMACYGSPFEESACAVIDSYGERGAMAFYRYQNRQLTLLHEAKGLSKASLGLFYMKLTELCGFGWLKGEEWKVMGLAAYGKLNPAFYEKLQAIIVTNGFDCMHPDKELFKHLADLDKFRPQAGCSLEIMADVAYTGQKFFAELVSNLLNHLQQLTGSENLALAGGCALNSSFNGQITQRTGFNRAYIPPAPADDGCALGAAWLAYHDDRPGERKPPQIQMPYLGSIIENKAVERLIKFNRSLNIRQLPDSICQETAKLLAEGKLIGWVQGRAEYGPRALGNRSILADPRNSEIQDVINDRVKFREMFRPFAPSVLPEFAEEYFECCQDSPYMDKTLVIKPEKREKIAAVCHVDGTGRLQTVKQEWNPLYFELIRCFYQLTGVPVLLNTSFNVMGKPLVHSLEDAVAVFMTTGLDALVVNGYLITKPDSHVCE